MNFADRLILAVRSKGNAVCVGLDPRLSNLPQEIVSGIDTSSFQQAADCYEIFCKEIIDVVADQVPLVKPQMAFFELLGSAGIACLGRVIDHARSKGLLVLLDAKRGDIGTTAMAYAHAYLGDGTQLTSDALTVNPYMGVDTLEPFLKVATANQNGLFVLVKTSNPGSGDFQDLSVTPARKSESENGVLHEEVARRVDQLAKHTQGENGYGAVGAVVGATYPQQLASLRSQMPNTLFLIPGYGAQGGGFDDVVPGFDSNGLGAVVNSSRGIIFAYENPSYQNGGPWQLSIESACRDMCRELSLDRLIQARKNLTA